MPTPYDEALAAVRIKGAGVVAYPLGTTMTVGWNLAEGCVRMYLGFGGALFGKDDAAGRALGARLGAWNS